MAAASNVFVGAGVDVCFATRSRLMSIFADGLRAWTPPVCHSACGVDLDCKAWFGRARDGV